jgi:hypothetical protein
MLGMLPAINGHTPDPNTDPIAYDAYLRSLLRTQRQGSTLSVPAQASTSLSSQVMNSAPAAQLLADGKTKLTILSTANYENWQYDLAARLKTEGL